LKKNNKGNLKLGDAIMQIFGAYLITIVGVMVSILLIYLVFDKSMLQISMDMQFASLQKDLKAGLITQAQVDQFNKSNELTGPGKMLVIQSALFLMITAALGLFTSLIAAYFIQTKPAKPKTETK
jgi:hypothetical protein